MRDTLCPRGRLKLTVALLGVVMVMGVVSPSAALAQVVDEEAHAMVLGGLLAAWNAGDARGVVRHFGAGAVVGDGWTAYTGDAGLTGWVEGEVRAGVVLAAKVEGTHGGRGTWRLALSSAADRRLGLPAIERWADVELRDGLITSMVFRSDPLSRERYSRALAVVAAQSLPHGSGALGESSAGSGVRAPGAAMARGGFGWITAAFALTVVVVVAARR